MNFSTWSNWEDIVRADMSQQTEYPVDLNILTFRQHVIIKVTTTILILALLSYGLRLYAKRITAAHIWWDDYLIGIGLWFAIIPCICNYVGLKYGLGRHTETLPATYPGQYLICLYILLLGWIMSETLIKYGILLFYWRVFPGKHFRWSIWIVGIFFLLCFLASFIGLMLQCVPIKDFWDPAIHTGCMNQRQFYNATASLCLIGDIILLIQPLPIIVRLKASTQTRFGLCLVFLTGGLVVIVSAFRLASLHDVTQDLTYTIVAPALWTSAEVAIGVVSANLPFMRPILAKIWRKAEGLHASYKGMEEQEGPDDRQTLRGQGFSRMSPTGDKARSMMGLTSTIHPGQESDTLDFELGIPMHGIAVRTELECRIEQVRTERAIQEPPRLMIRAGSGKPHGWADPSDHNSKSDIDEEF